MMGGKGNLAEHIAAVMKYVLLVFTLSTLLATKCSGQINRPPEFLKGGDMDKFSIPEDTPVGSSVYRLRAHDPEKTRVHYYISGDSFTAERESGVVRLVRPLDREADNAVDVIISITDEGSRGMPPNTISIKREITVLDQNDNPPKFQNLPYTFELDETTAVGTTVFKNILVTDADIGINAEIKLSCMSDVTPDACLKFEIRGSAISNGRAVGQVVLVEPLDYEEKTSYTMTIAAEDQTKSGRLKTVANLQIEVKDIQDQPPAFQNAPYTATVMENSMEGTSVLNLVVSDGDAGNPRDVMLFIENDRKSYFRLGPASSDSSKVSTVTLETNNAIDREDPDVLESGGLYVFQITATELINGLPIGDHVTTDVTIVIGDVNDQEPLFNQDEFNVTVPEDIGSNTPLPGLNIVVTDLDVGDNAKFSLELEDILNSDGIFSVFPTTAVGRTPLVIRVTNASRLDYEDPNKRLFVFRMKASQENSVGHSAVVRVTLVDANDNPPLFGNDQYVFQVPENASPGTSIFTLPAFDADSGDFGRVTYTLKGFGSDKFQVDERSGEISVSDCGAASCLDFESQKSYSLTYEAQDGGGRLSTVNVFVEVVDVNDNAPQFARDVYTQEVLENTVRLLPPLFVKATDSDGPTQGGGKVTYSIASSELQDSFAVTIDPDTGEVTFQRPLRHSETPNGSGLFTVVVQARDYGRPPLASTTKLLLKIKKENDGAPEFVGLPYSAVVKENAMGGTSVLRVAASDPDGPDSGISYFLHSGAKDNFVIGEKSGLVAVASGADLDRDVYGAQYTLHVQAVDSGIPVQQTATATVLLHIEDVNNKPPKFAQDSYVEYISEGTEVGSTVVTVSASDSDSDAKIRYSIVEPIIARDKTGSVVRSSAAYNYKNAFRIDGTTGQISVGHSLDYNAASVIILTVQAVDLNAIDITFGRQQKASVEVTVYVRAHGEMNPVFSPPWTLADPSIEITLPEETLVGSTLLTLSARDPLTHAAVMHYEKIPGSDPDNYVSVSPVSGVVALNRRLDFEEIPQQRISFKVKAIIGDVKSQRSSEAVVVVNVQDINDNSPVFSQNTYTTSISESSKFPQSILTVIASDKDSQGGFGTVQYSISGDGSDVFRIDEKSGTISVAENAILDREQQATYNLQVTATDNPNEISNQRRTSIIVTIKVLDENDNAPQFHQEIYSAVIPENVPTDFSVIAVRATDADSGSNGELHYAIVQDADGQPINFFSVDPQTGVVSVIKALSGKGRSEPYTIKIQATDRGNPPLHSVSHLLVVIGDISTNDGVPQFIRPTAGEVAYIYENVSVGSEVFQVVAFDPDNANTANGKVAFKLQDDQSSEVPHYEFAIDAATGLITTRAPLDRERKENYTMIVVAHDFGFPPQEAHRVLRIIVMDVDDSDPQFLRPLKSQPIEILMKEELPVGTVAGIVRAVDNDTGINSVIEYHIIDGNEDDAFGIRRAADGAGELVVMRRIDRERVSRFVLTVKASRPGDPLANLSKPYDFRELSEMQVAVAVEDLDDNPPIFETSSYVLGARGNTEVNTELVKLHANDPDVSSSPVMYSIQNITFTKAPSPPRPSEALHAGPQSGLLLSNEALGKYVGGHFDVTVEARSSPGMHNVAFAHVKIYVLQDRDLLKFVFYKRPNEVREIMPKFENDLKAALAQPISLNVYDTHFYARSDGSLDFESTSSCFQLLQNDVIIEPKKVLKILNKAKSPSVKALYQNYSVVAIENCSPGREAYRMVWSEIIILVIAGVIALVSFVFCILICIMYSSYRTKVKRVSYFHHVYMTENGGHLPILSPAEQQRIYEWQEMNGPLADAASFRSYPTSR